jgi:hypothetical protein
MLTAADCRERAKYCERIYVCGRAHSRPVPPTQDPRGFPPFRQEPGLRLAAGNAIRHSIKTFGLKVGKVARGVTARVQG